MHPLADLITDATRGRFPAVDGGWERVPLWRPGLEAVLAFTGHAVLVVAADVSDGRLEALGVDGLGGANHPRVLLDLAGPSGWIDSLDVVLAARATGPAPGRAAGRDGLVERPDLTEHPRAQFARAARDDVRVLGYPDPARRSVATVSRGIGGLTEMSVEVEPGARGQGLGRALVRAALATAPAGELVLAAVAPGNVASLRAFTAAGFGPVCSVQLLRPARLSAAG